MTIEERLTAAGLSVSKEDLPKLASIVLDMDKLAASLRGPRPYAEEPLSAFRLQRG